MTVNNSREARTVASACWAAWGDAVGFISELTDVHGLQRRLQGQPFTGPVAWSRRVGGQYGVPASLPAGCYSDDTQLRLATSRCVNDGSFNVDAFSKIELPVWPNYALGGGRASKNASQNLVKPAVAWYSNFFDGWVNAGGNGVAMRIQPHVWAAPNPGSTGDHITGLLINGVTTHGHPRALVGAVIHALALGRALEFGEPVNSDDWPELIELAWTASDEFQKVAQIEAVWLPTWEAAADVTFAFGWASAIEEFVDLLPACGAAVGKILAATDANSQLDAYDSFCREVGLHDKQTMGSGILTVAAALVLVAAFPADPRAAGLLAAHAIGTDTDTIATMALAILGATVTELPNDLMDRDYLICEAVRLSTIAAGGGADRFDYPDLLHWAPPRSQLDLVGTVGGELAMAGFGNLSPLGDESFGTKSSIWRWTRTTFGQSILVKSRRELHDLPAAAMPMVRVKHQRPGKAVVPLNGEPAVAPDVSHEPGPAVPPGPTTSTRSRVNSLGAAEVEDMLAWVRAHHFEDAAIGLALRRVALRAGPGFVSGFAVALAAELSDRDRPRP